MYKKYGYISYISIMKSMVDHRADIEDMDGVNTDKLLEAMEIEF